jgi:hypothetical protein
MSDVTIASSVQSMDRLRVYTNDLDTITFQFDQVIAGEGNEDGTYGETIEVMGEITLTPEDAQILQDLLRAWSYRIEASKYQNPPMGATLSCS